MVKLYGEATPPTPSEQTPWIPTLSHLKPPLSRSAHPKHPSGGPARAVFPNGLCKPSNEASWPSSTMYKDRRKREGPPTVFFNTTALFVPMSLWGGDCGRTTNHPHHGRPFSPQLVFMSLVGKRNRPKEGGPVRWEELVLGCKRQRPVCFHNQPPAPIYPIWHRKSLTADCGCRWWKQTLWLSEPNARWWAPKPVRNGPLMASF